MITKRFTCLIFNIIAAITIIPAHMAAASRPTPVDSILKQLDDVLDRRDTY